MAFTYRIDADAGLLIIVSDEAPMTQAERMDAMRAWMSDPLYRPGLDTLFDITISPTVPSLAQLQEVAIYMDRRADAVGRKRIAVVTGTPVTYGVARQFQALTDTGQLTVNIFSSRSDALGWLGRGDMG